VRGEDGESTVSSSLSSLTQVTGMDDDALRSARGSMLQASPMQVMWPRYTLFTTILSRYYHVAYYHISVFYDAWQLSQSQCIALDFNGYYDSPDTLMNFSISHGYRNDERVLHIYIHN
jgi:hypothetical protein